MLLALDRIKTMLPSSVILGGLNDGGMFVDTLDVDLGPGYTEIFAEVYAMQQAQVDDDCKKAAGVCVRV